MPNQPQKYEQAICMIIGGKPSLKELEPAERHDAQKILGATRRYLEEFADAIKGEAIHIGASEESWFEGNAVDVDDIDATLARFTGGKEK